MGGSADCDVTTTVGSAAGAGVASPGAATAFRARNAASGSAVATTGEGVEETAEELLVRAFLARNAASGSREVGSAAAAEVGGEDATAVECLEDETRLGGEASTDLEMRRG